ncbi:Acg family FMN-binding oxidoreductase [Roseobacter sinensis]|uniref:Twin-arginine translocation pathway signal protein n=1 Tax=Roseobacter sinensis TaxID=2931391 RepID=A0ABT3BA56_9RHOB|nr:twin-arginine translocation pathway signal protein [Roseobacter sp. WL0113]MCV3270462.1 twin-arginine translocation pathway signal protein [Roseobacter sp. WL0113]
MPMPRRKALTLIGGGTVLAATASAGGFLATRTPHAALAPWEGAGDYDDPRLNALSYALLAPNPHNLQPWQIDLEGADAVLIYRDPARRLPETDPFDRQITIGLGCFIEQMILAAGAADHRVDLKLYPEGEDGPVARATFTEGGEADPLSAQILARRSCKEPFAETPLSPAHANELELYADVYTDIPTVAALKKLTWAAWEVEAMTPHTMRESVDLMRFGKAEIEANPDGIDLGGPMLESLMLAGVLSREAQSDPESRGFQQGVEIYREMLHATPAYAALTSPTNTRADQIEAGRRWLRLNLKCTTLGVALHPVSQCLQEYPEMADHYTAAHKRLAGPGQTVQMLGRLGYGPDVPRTPRWPLETKLLNA